MDVSNSTITGSVVPPAGNTVKAAATSETGVPIEARKPAPQGNSLPGEGQGRVPSENPPAEASASKPSPEELQKLVDQANAAVRERFSDVKFSVAEESNTNIVRIEDSETGELIRQIPSEEMLAVARALDKLKQGTMFEGKA